MRMFYINQLLQRYDSLRTNYKEKLEEIKELQIEVLAIIKDIENRDNIKDINFIEILDFIQTELFLLQQKALKKLIKKGGYYEKD
ncbi:hypothetical protein [Aliarcobacter skirrowii]|uniref:hypothetical protein n=1 Tax=Aliarcobacter skirrowii TaxID=28200 RepID=UPI000D620233|nr:hypothetical protein [Aliarcobacter skirrowii]PWE20084.1 hypothetical protein DGF29_06955 [Aliarcobacter skirrowii]PWE26327.1 hypothetical protein DGE88_00990 [Aliarcobacter skirrowii]RJO55531.1 hypothetical protein DIR39_06960 [Aliarcobacter skirrowii]RJO57486.1 hypothetical protein DIR38_06960 [Aliarcobacter skirrowii]